VRAVLVDRDDDGAGNQSEDQQQKYGRKHGILIHVRDNVRCAGKCFAMIREA
jgi:hypothetical protein